jgi:hypothetical protein
MELSQKKFGIYCLANDAVIEWFEAFIRSYQLDNAALPLTVIPFNENISRLKSLKARFRFDILDEAECRRFDALANQVTGSDRLAGAYRKFASFFGPYDEFLFLDSDMVVITPLIRLFQAFSKSDHDFVYFDYDLDMAYKPSLAARMTTEYGTHGFNSGAFISRKGIIRENELPSLAGKAAAVREGLAGTLEQPFLNFVMDVSRRRMTGMNTLLPELAPKVWARQSFHYDRRNRLAKTPDGKLLPFIHWPGCGYPTMVRPEIFLEYRTLGMNFWERLDYRRKFYYLRCRKNLKRALLQSKLFEGLLQWRDRHIQQRQAAKSP